MQKFTVLNASHCCIGRYWEERVPHMVLAVAHSYDVPHSGILES